MFRNVQNGIVAGVMVAVVMLSSVGAATADEPNMQRAMDAIFGASGPVKKLKIRGHDFNFPQRAKIVQQQARELPPKR